MKINVFDEVEVISTGQRGKVIMLIGCMALPDSPRFMLSGDDYGVREAYVDMYPGADSGYEYITMWDEDEGRVELRALNKYPIEDIKLYSEDNLEFM